MADNQAAAAMAANQAAAAMAKQAAAEAKVKADADADKVHIPYQIIHSITLLPLLHAVMPHHSSPSTFITLNQERTRVHETSIRYVFEREELVQNATETGYVSLPTLRQFASINPNLAKLGIFYDHANANVDQKLEKEFFAHLNNVMKFCDGFVSTTVVDAVQRSILRQINVADKAAAEAKVKTDAAKTEAKAAKQAEREKRRVGHAQQRAIPHHLPSCPSSHLSPIIPPCPNHPFSPSPCPRVPSFSCPSP